VLTRSSPGGERNAGGVRFTPRGGKFTIWDNQADGTRVRFSATTPVGVNDRWKFAGEPNDATSDTFQLPALIDERYKSICFGIFKAGPNVSCKTTTRSCWDQYKSTSSRGRGG
jgi:hypothetical protein